MTQQNETTNSPNARLAGTLKLGDLTINRLGFGAMRLSTNGFQGPARDPETGRAVLRRALELGVNHIDTAAFYHSRDGSVRANTLIARRSSRTRRIWLSPPRSARRPGPMVSYRRLPPTCASRWKTISRHWGWSVLTWSTCGSV